MTQLVKKKALKIVNLDIFGRKVHEEGFEGLGYTPSGFDFLQQGENSSPVMDAAADVFFLVVVGVHAITLF